jgi:hypothetical protein
MTLIEELEHAIESHEAMGRLQAERGSMQPAEYNRNRAAALRARIARIREDEARLAKYRLDGTDFVAGYDIAFRRLTGPLHERQATRKV